MLNNYLSNEFIYYGTYRSEPQRKLSKITVVTNKENKVFFL